MSRVSLDGLDSLGGSASPPSSKAKEPEQAIETSLEDAAEADEE
jgi:hypothetical protein